MKTFIPNLHVIKVIALPPTNTKPARIKVISERFREYKIISYDQYDLGGDNTTAYECAITYLQTIGHSVVAKGEGKGCMYVISETFDHVKFNK